MLIIVPLSHLHDYYINMAHVAVWKRVIFSYLLDKIYLSRILTINVVFISIFSFVITLDASINSKIKVRKFQAIYA